MRGSIWLSLLATIVLLVLFPLLFAHLMATSLTKLHLGAESAMILVVGIIFGSFVNIPVRRVRHTREVVTHPLFPFGMFELWPRLQRVHQVTVVAVNVGGCVVPSGLAIYEMIYLGLLDPQVLWFVVAVAAVNVVVCYLLAKPVPGVGIAMPGLVPALVAATSALLLAPEHAAPVAFIAGVSGPLVGADLFHLKDIEKVASGVLSIGGAGTFDGIVLSGIVAAYLA